MKIALAYNEILPAPRYGGIERVVMGLARGYREAGHEVFILAKKGSKLPGYDHGFYDDQWESMDLADLIPGDVDFIHSHQPIRRRPSKPFLVTIHGNASPKDSFFPNTNFVSHSHARNHSAKYFVYQGVEIENLPYSDAKDNYFLFMAKAKWRVKNLRTAIDFANDTQTPLKVIGGHGRSSRYVEYLGFLGDHEGRLEILSRARALLYPTNWDEPCAMAPLEALACGTPVIASANGSMPEEISSDTGFVCTTYAQMLKAYEHLSSISAKDCRKACEDKFSHRRMAHDYLELIQRILQMGDLDHQPSAIHRPSSIQYVFKPKLMNRIHYAVRGKI